MPDPFASKNTGQPMKRNALADLGEIRRQHRDRATLITDVVVNVLNAFASYHIDGEYSFQEIEQLIC
jgi:hypothetical protein